MAAATSGKAVSAAIRRLVVGFRRCPQAAADRGLIGLSIRLISGRLQFSQCPARSSSCSYANFSRLRPVDGRSYPPATNAQRAKLAMLFAPGKGWLRPQRWWWTAPVRNWESECDAPLSASNAVVYRWQTWATGLAARSLAQHHQPVGS